MSFRVGVGVGCVPYQVGVSFRVGWGGGGVCHSELGGVCVIPVGGCVYTGVSHWLGWSQ